MYVADKFIQWGRVMHICVGEIAIIGSDNGLLSGRRPAIIWTKAGLLLTHWGRDKVTVIIQTEFSNVFF